MWPPAALNISKAYKRVKVSLKGSILKRGKISAWVETSSCQTGFHVARSCPTGTAASPVKGCPSYPAAREVTAQGATRWSLTNMLISGSCGAVQAGGEACGEGVNMGTALGGKGVLVTHPECPCRQDASSCGRHFCVVRWELPGKEHKMVFSKYVYSLWVSHVVVYLLCCWLRFCKRSSLIAS